MHRQDPRQVPSDQPPPSGAQDLGGSGKSREGSSPPACRCLHLHSSFPRKQMVDQTSQALGFPSVWRRARAPRPLPAVQGDRPHPTRNSRPPPTTTCSPRQQRGPATVTRDFLFFFCWLQAFFCLSENETDTPSASPPADTRTRTHALARPASRPPVSGAGPALRTQPRAAQSGERRRCLALARSRAQLPAARRPPPGSSAPRPVGRSAGCTPRPGTPRGARAEAARRQVRAAEGAAGPGTEARSSARCARTLRIRWVSRGAARAPGGRSWARPGGLRAWRWGAAGMRSGLLLRPCPVSALPVSSLLFLSLSLCPSPCPYPVPATASAQPPGSPEGLRRGSPYQVRGMGAGEKRPGGHGVGPPSPRNLERSEGSVPSCGAGHRMALAPDRTGRGCPWEGGAWEGKERGA